MEQALNLSVAVPNTTGFRDIYPCIIGITTGYSGGKSEVPSIQFPL